MKTSALFAVIMATTTFLSAHSVSDSDFIKCREYAVGLDKNFSTSHLIEHDLIHGIWTALLPDGMENTYLFTQKGLVQILQTDLDGNRSYQSSFWRVAEFDSQPFLILSDNEHKEKLLSVDQTCEGITLTDVVNHQVLAIHYQPLKASPKLNLTKDYLVGEWTNVSAFENLENNKTGIGSFLDFQFAADGTYTCNYGNREIKVSEIGTWEISKDNQYLLLHAAEDKDFENIKCTQVIRISQVDDHGLILEQVMKTNDINEFFGSNNKTFAFIK